ncbi:sigma-24 (FecI) [Alcanivorax sp. S71-1-4]|uniref:RNA polymerase sigma factor SigJ n=1 Tax=Alcanivorax sp. S71-1-4 TaxID=1177159 RepID=UPI001358632B|nr:RNA polymerase sigma factor SigJ [Alcanivorax sp. S71-1-4]KAF0805984.1 sigma-24 (FecI) [Alcanivorax sp. S71-1-4]
MIEPQDIRLFEARRGFLTGLAYRILGSVAEAEDAVQDTFLKWSQADRAVIAHPEAWLTTACTRRSIDLLRAAHQVRVDYVGAWLPEPLQAEAGDAPDAALELSSSLSVAFLLLLERLTPRERAAYLLHDVFDQPYEEVALALGVQEAACRKLVSRARQHVGDGNVRSAVPPVRQRALLAAFQEAVASGDTASLALLMSDDIELRTDGGGKVQALLAPLSGKAPVLDFIAGRLNLYWRAYTWHLTWINGGYGALLVDAGHIVASVSFACDAAGRATGIFIMRNPDKLARLAAPCGL